MGKKEQNEIRENCVRQLQDWIKPGTTIYTVLRHVSKSGMTRCIDLYYMENNEPMRISYQVAKVLKDSIDSKTGAIKVSGCGMDMGFALVNSLSYALHGMKDVGQAAIEAGKQGTFFRPKEDAYRAGYSLEHRWM